LFAGHAGVHAQTSPQASVPSKAQGAPQQDSDDSSARSKQILDHLNAVLRFYRDSEAPIQKVGEPSDLLYRDQAVTLAAQIAGFAFQSAKAEAGLMGRSPKAAQPAPTSQSQSQ